MELIEYSDKREKIFCEKKIRKKIKESNCFLHLLAKRKRCLLFFDSTSKKFFAMDKAAFEKIGIKHLAKNKIKPFIKPKNHFAYFNFSITSECNLACKYCFGNEAERTGKDSNWLTLKGAIDFLAKQKKPIEILIAAPGEHTIKMGLLKRTLDYIKKKLQISKLSISVNGTADPAKYLEIIDHFDRFQISCDGPPKIHDLQRPMKSGGKSSPKIEKTITTLVKEGKKFSVRPTITHNHIGHERETFKYFYDLSVPSIVLSPVGDMGAGYMYIKKNKIKNKDLQLSMLTIKELCDEFGIPAKLPIENYFGHKELGYCLLGTSFNLGVDGLVSACSSYSDENDLKIHKGLEKLIIGKFNPEKREFEIDKKKIKYLKQIHKKANCYDCNFKLCWGGCPLRNLRRGKIEEPTRFLCNERPTYALRLMKYWLYREALKIMPCLSEKNGGLYYTMQFSEFPLKVANSKQIPNKSALVKFDPTKDDLPKMLEKMVSVTKKRKGITLFVLSPTTRQKLNAKRSIVFKDFLYSLKQNKVIFKVSKPVKITDSSELKEKEFYQTFQIPQDCFECLEMFRLRNNSVFFCNGKKAGKMNNFLDRFEIFDAFMKNNKAPMCNKYK